MYESLYQIYGDTIATSCLQHLFTKISLVSEKEETKESEMKSKKDARISRYMRILYLRAWYLQNMLRRLIFQMLLLIHYMWWAKKSKRN